MTMITIKPYHARKKIYAWIKETAHGKLIGFLLNDSTVKMRTFFYKFLKKLLISKFHCTFCAHGKKSRIHKRLFFFLGFSDSLHCTKVFVYMTDQKKGRRRHIFVMILIGIEDHNDYVDMRWWELISLTMIFFRLSKLNQKANNRLNKTDEDDEVFEYLNYALCKLTSPHTKRHMPSKHYNHLLSIYPSYYHQTWRIPKYKNRMQMLH